jgi:hypothetical protein
VRIDVLAIAQMLMDDPTLGSVHRWKIDRGPVAQSLLGGLLGLLLKLLATFLSVAGSVDLYPDPLTVARIALNDPRRKVLDSVNCLPVLTDE